jgi:hypothetical protein
VAGPRWGFADRKSTMSRGCSISATDDKIEIENINTPGKTERFAAPAVLGRRGPVASRLGSSRSGRSGSMGAST